MRLFKHLKTGNSYEVIFDAIDATNSREGVPIVVYRRKDTLAPIFTRDKAEFNSKFSPFTKDT